MALYPNLLATANQWPLTQTFTTTNVIGGGGFYGDSNGLKVGTSASFGFASAVNPINATDAVFKRSAASTVTLSSDGGTGAANLVVTGLVTASGVTDGSAAAAGKIGEIITSSLVLGSATALTTSTAKTITSISLTAGCWDVAATGGFTGGATTTLTFALASISATNNTMDATEGRQVGTFPMGSTIFAQNNLQQALAPVRINLSATTTYYLVGVAVFGTSTCSAYGNIRATRVR